MIINILYTPHNRMHSNDIRRIRHCTCSKKVTDLLAWHRKQINKGGSIAARTFYPWKYTILPTQNSQSQEIHRPTDFSCRFLLFFLSESYTKLSIPADYQSKVVFVLQPPSVPFVLARRLRSSSCNLHILLFNIVCWFVLGDVLWGVNNIVQNQATVEPYFHKPTHKTYHAPHTTHTTHHTHHTPPHTHHTPTHTPHTHYTHTRPPICQDPTRSNKINQRIGKHNSTCRCDYSRVVWPQLGRVTTAGSCDHKVVRAIII